MEITEEQYRQIEHCLPKQRGNVSHANLRVINAILYVADECDDSSRCDTPSASSQCIRRSRIIFVQGDTSCGRVAIGV